MYEELGWDLSDGGAVKKTPTKRGAKGEGVDGETPTKKSRTPRAKKGKGKDDEVKKDEVANSDEDEVEPEGEVTAGVKEEQVDDEEV